MTQVEYPALYGDLLDLDRPVVALVAVRNILLVAFFVATLWRLARSREPVHGIETTVHAFVHKGGTR